MKKLFKSVIAIIALIIVVPAFIGACTSFRRGYNNAKNASVSGTTTAEKKVSVATSETTGTDESAAEPTETQNIVVYEQNGIKISYTGIEEKPSRYELKFLIENDTDLERSIVTDNLSINGFMVGDSLYSSIAAHKKINDSITVYKKTLEENNISDIENVEFIFRIYESDNLSNYFETDIVSLNVE